VAALGSDAKQGLSSKAARERLLEHGPNELRTAGGRSRLAILLGQFADLMIALLAVAAVISATIGEWGDSLLIALILLANGLIGYFQERRAENAVAALKRMSRSTTTVWRDAALTSISTMELVPGDVIELTTGDLTPADARLLDAVNLTTDEAPLTGESLPVEKSTQRLAAETPLPERSSMLYSGTSVATGRARAIVTATGMQSELGVIAGMISAAQSEPTPLQQRLAVLSKRLAAAVAIVCIVVFAAGLLRGDLPVNVLFLTAVSLAVAAVPEGLPAVITVTLALGSQRMVRRRAIIRQLSAVETLGSVDVICSDKTGTLTQNRMTVADLAPVDDSPDSRDQLLLAAVLCNDARLAESGEIIGSATESALLQAALERGADVAAWRAAWRREVEFPFSSERKRMSVVHRGPDEAQAVFVKGAVEQVLHRSTQIVVGGQAVELGDERRGEWERVTERLTGDGRRVLGLAMRAVAADSAPQDADAAERDLTFLGCVGLVDPVRPEARAAIAACRSAGIRPVMITGDHRGTARAIASELELLRDGDETLTGAELDRLSDPELAERAPNIAVYARVAPEHKLRIVRAHQSRGAVVAMTGDGVNDAPALKQADIGVAMGVTGTDVSREASNMILADDNFATIVAAVEEGRVVYDNIRKFVRYLLTTNTGEVLVLFVAIVAGMPLPLLPIHLLWINLVTDGLPALALGFEPAEEDVMRRRPRRRNESMFAGGMARAIFLYGGLMASICLAVYGWYLYAAPHSPSASEAEVYARTVVFTTLALFQLFYVLAIRSSSQSFFSQSPLSNYRLTGAVGLGVALQLAVIYVPWLREVFHTARLDGADLAVAMIAATTAFSAAELQKLVARK
jgi:Ca2+-transporting ATPase